MQETGLAKTQYKTKQNTHKKHITTQFDNNLNTNTPLNLNADLYIQIVISS